MAGETVTRPIFDGIGHVGEIVFYVLATASIVIFGYGVWRRVRSTGGAGRRAAGPRSVRPCSVGRSPVCASVVTAGSAAVVATNVTVGRGSRAVGLAHFGVFWGFIVLFIGTVILTIDYDVVRLAGRLFTGA